MTRGSGQLLKRNPLLCSSPKLTMTGQILHCVMESLMSSGKVAARLPAILCRMQVQADPAGHPLICRILLANGSHLALMDPQDLHPMDRPMDRLMVLRLWGPLASISTGLLGPCTTPLPLAPLQLVSSQPPLFSDCCTISCMSLSDGGYQHEGF